MVWALIIITLGLFAASSCFGDNRGQVMQRLMRLSDASVHEKKQSIYKGDYECTNGDIALVIDSSSSISATDFKTGLQFLSDFTRLFDVGPKTIRFSAISFGRGIYIEDAFGFEAHTDNDDVSDAILDMTHHGGTYTSTGEGIRYMRENLMKYARDDVQKIAIVITDGNSQETDITEKEAEMTRNSDVTVFAIGVGKHISYDELKKIASKPETIIMVDDYNSLSAIKYILDTLICKAITIGKCGIGDISLVIDSSSSIWKYNYEDGLKFLSNFTNTFKIGPDNVRVSAVSFSDVVHKEDAFGFDQYDTADSLSHAIKSMPHRAGNRTETGLAIKYMRENQMSQARHNVNRTTVVITDGRSQEADKTAEEASKSRAAGIVMFAIGVGPNVLQSELNSIASKEDYVMMVDDYASLKKIQDRLDFLVCGELADTPCGMRNPSDIYLVYDGNYLGGDYLKEINQFIKTSVSQKDLNKGMQIGVISGDCEGTKSFPLNQYNTLAELGYHIEPQLQSDLTALVRYLHTEGFTKENGGRRYANRVAVLFVDSKVSIDELQQEVEIAKSQDILVFIVGFGNVDYEGLQQLSSQPPEKYVLMAGSTSDLANTFANRLCDK